MRIISGTAKGRKLFSPKSHLIRPVSDKVKGAIFNILFNVEDCRILDLFAGSGSVGLEATSRGASLVVFVDSMPEAVNLVKKNILLCGFEKNTAVFRGSIPSIIPRLKKFSPFDYVFIDPPYDKGLVVPTLTAVCRHKLVDAESRIIIEHSPKESTVCAGFSPVSVRKYGQTLVSFLKTAD